MKRKVEEEVEIQEGEIVEAAWNKKRILIGLATLVILLGTGAFFLTGDGTQQQDPHQEVLSSQDVANHVAPSIAPPSAETVENIITNVTENLSTITTDNFVSSQAAIQKAIQDLQSLQGGDKNVAVETMCKLMCAE